MGKSEEIRYLGFIQKNDDSGYEQRKEFQRELAKLILGQIRELETKIKLNTTVTKLYI